MFEEYADNFQSREDIFPRNTLFRLCFDPIANAMKLMYKRADLFEELQNAFSVDNPQAFFSQQYGYKGQSKLFAINKFGYFSPGLVFEILEWIRLHYGDLQLVAISNKCKSFMVDVLNPLKDFKLAEIANISDDSGRNNELEREGKTKYEFRDYQKNAIETLFNKGHGRGLIEIPTAGGKSFILANFIWNVLKNVDRNAKTLILVPNVQLVEQFYKDLTDYGFQKSELAKMMGGMKKNEKAENDPNKAKIIVANRQYLFKNAKALPKIDILVCDEVHQAVASSTQAFIEKCPARIRIGCSGTLPKDKFQLWTLVGMLGRVVYKEEITTLQSKGFISKLRITLLDIFHREVESNKNLLFNMHSTTRYNSSNPNESEIFFNDAYLAEMDFFKNHYEELYTPIIQYLKNLPENTLVLFDSIEIGKSLFELAQTNLSLNKRGIYYIDGSQKIEDRENVRSKFEENDGNVLFAQSQTFSTGVNIKRLTHVVFMFQSKSFSRIVQSIGRALRLHFSKKEAHVVDVRFNFKYSNKHYSKRLVFYEEVYNKKKPDEIVKIVI